MDVTFEKRLLRPFNGLPCSPVARNLFGATPTPGTSGHPRPGTSPVRSLFRGDSLRSPIRGPAVKRSPSMLHSPLSSPKKAGYGDRFIPSRSGNNWEVNFSPVAERAMYGSVNGVIDTSEGSKEYPVVAYSSLLRNEILGTEIEDCKGALARWNANMEASNTEDERPTQNSQYGQHRGTPTSSPNLFTYKTKAVNFVNEPSSSFSLTPISSKSQKLLRLPRKATRKISKLPFKVLDAPELADDFYLNLVDWSSQNVLSVGLGTCVYLWSACTSQVTRLCDLTGEGDNVTSVAWAERGNLVAVGTHKGYVQIWDVTTNKKLNTLDGHTARVGATAWNGDSLSSGSRDRLILQRDIRTPPLITARRLEGHRQEVCGLKWSPDNSYLASGGNDNKLFIWNLSNSGSSHSAAAIPHLAQGNQATLTSEPVYTFTDHIAAVKAIAWSPHHHGLLASGGGTADRCIRFWNTLTGQAMQCMDTGSQVCNLAWSKHSSELVSTHGYSQNQILVWKYPSLVQVAKLTGHSYRVLYLAMSPDGESIVTGAGDETLRFWNIFSKARSQKEAKSALNLFTSIR